MVTRGSGIESRHRVHAAVVDGNDCLSAPRASPSMVTMWRSCAKPFQVMPLIAFGGFDEVGWGDDELALACASHGGEPEHVAIAESMLRDLGLEEGDLACGPHEPLSPRGARIIREAGARPTRLHNNCSGKHAAMLARAHFSGWTLSGYERDEHPVQLAALQEVSRWTDVPEARSFAPSMDAGSSSSAFRSTQWLAPTRASPSQYPVARRFPRASREPSRRDRSCSEAPIDSTRSSWRKRAVASIPKVGAEGVHSVALFELGLGFAIKVEDGATRAQYPAVLHLLDLLGAFPAGLSPKLAEYARARIRNTRGEVVGELFPASA